MDFFVWRYLPTKYFLDLIQTRKLYLRRTDRFPSDKLDSQVPIHVINEWKAKVVADYSHLPDNLRGAFFSFDMFDYCRKMLFASCWCDIQEESEYHWMNFGSNPDCIAVRVTAEKLIDSISAEGVGRFLNAKVAYRRPDDLKLTDIGDPLPSMSAPAFLKNIKFEPESEFRLVVLRDHYDSWNLENSEFEMSVPCSVDKLDLHIRYRPDLPHTDREGILQGLIDTGLSADFHQSRICV